MDPRLHLKASAVACLFLWAVGCGANGRSRELRHPPAKPPEAVRQVLVAELRRQIAGWSRTVPVREREVSWFGEPSAVVPGLQYYGGDLRPVAVMHGVAQAVVGVRGPTLVLLGSEHAWAALTEQWSPANEEQVVTACREFIRAAGRSRLRANVPHLLTRASYEREGLFPDQFAAFSSRTGVDGPEVIRGASGWRATVWVPEARLGYFLYAMRYECTFPAGDDPQRAPKLVVVDSIPGRSMPVE